MLRNTIAARTDRIRARGKIRSSGSPPRTEVLFISRTVAGVTCSVVPLKEHDLSVEVGGQPELLTEQNAGWIAEVGLTRLRPRGKVGTARIVGVVGRIRIDQVLNKCQRVLIEALLRRGVVMPSEGTCLDLEMSPVMRRQDGLNSDLLALLVGALNIEGHGPAIGILGKGIRGIDPVITAQTSAIERMGLALIMIWRYDAVPVGNKSKVKM